MRTGHHHLLIDKPLPIPPNRPIPFDDHHVHFGKGQMERVLDLPPGRHTLRLLLANHAHVPYFIYSPEITVTVKPGRSNLPADYGKQPRVEIVGLADNAVVKPPFRVNFHASGLNVASSAAKVKGTGHFQLLLRPTAPGGKDVTLDFAGGETEAWLQPPAGSYRAQLVFVPNMGDASKPLATSGALNLRVDGNAP